MDLKKQKEYEQQALEVIKKKKIAFFDHAFAFLPFSRATAYNHGLEKLDTLKNALEVNRVTAKNYMLQKWISGNNPTLQIAAFRLISDTDEHKKLNQSYIDHTNKGDKFDSTVNVENEWMKLLREKKEEIGKSIE